VAYDQNHWIEYQQALRNPIRKKMWMNSHDSQAHESGDVNFAELGDGGVAPMVASVPLSQ